MSHDVEPLLLIEDDELDAFAIQRRLKKEGCLTPVHHLMSLTEAEAWLKHNTPSIILSDLNLTDSRGMETVRRIRQAAPDVGLVVLTGLAGDDIGVEAVRQGAQEYLVKGQLENQLNRTLRYATERARVEQALKASQQALLEAHKQEAIGRLAAKVAHDLNNMLTLILPCADMLKMRLHGDEEALGDVKMILEAARRSKSLVRGLLAFGRKQILRPAPLDLCALLERFNPLIDRTLGGSITLEYALDDDLPPVLFDTSQMELILVNLAANAREAVKPGGGRARITVRHASKDRPVGVPDGPFAELIFEDEGQGIAPDVLPRLFEPFFTTKPASGHGVGLASVYGVMRQSGGHICVESEHGRWTRFTLYVPFAEAAAQTPTMEISEIIEQPPGGSERILVVEDEAGVRQVVVRTLIQAGYTVLDAGNGPEALQVEACSDKHRIDLLLSDVVMPHTNTGAFVKEMCRRRPGMKVMFMSGYAADETVRHGVELGEHGFLHKPFTGNGLLRAVRKALDQNQSAAFTG